MKDIFSVRNKQIVFLAIAFLGLIVFEYLAPKEIDWKLSFSKDEKIPFGSYILFNTLPDLFPEKEIVTNEESIFQLIEKQNIDYKNFIFISDKFKPDRLDLKELLNFARKGNSIFISASEFGNNISDSLKFSVDFEWNKSVIIDVDSVNLNFCSNHVMKKKGFAYKKGILRNYFSKIDTAQSVVLGTYNDTLVNFIKVPLGKGYIYLHSQPLAFTNFNMLKGNNADYTFRALSFLPVQTTLWDEYFKPNKLVNTSPIRYVLSHKPLKAAYLVIIFGLAFYMFFEGKRRQRIIPVINPPANTSVEFTETISRLYMNSNNHKDLAIKKFTYLGEFLRSRYYLKTGSNLEEDCFRISEKTGASLFTTKKLIKTYNSIFFNTKITEIQLFMFSEIIDQFYAECK